MSSVMSGLPEWVKRPLRRVRDSVRGAQYRGEGRLCPVCGNTSRLFRPYGVVPRSEAECAHCCALERHRLLWLFLQQRTDLFDDKPKKMLHVAPELCFEPRLRQRLGSGYLTGDLFDSRAMVKMDVTDIRYPDESFDVVYCSHVLEHVQDDRRAMREFHRVLKHDGWAILLVPITSDKTFEDPSVVDPKERERLFGQDDHVRRYGPDYVDRLREAGFTVRVTTAQDLATPKQIVEMGLSGEIFFCTK